MSRKWNENDKGNWVLLNGGVVATVYQTAYETWAVVWNGADDGNPRRLKRKYASADEAMGAAEDAIDEGEHSPAWDEPESDWKKNKKNNGCYRKHDGLVISVKQAQSGSWYATNMHGRLLGQYGRPAWFSTAKEACGAVDAFARGVGQWGWASAR